MTYAPIIIPTLSRDKHFIRLMESLRKNPWSKYTDIYVGLDYPPSDKYRNGYDKICTYLERGFQEFNKVIVIKHKKNIGSSANLRHLINIVMDKYDRFIKTDDDAEFSPNFIEYMNKCLVEYEKDENVIAVTGYSYPIEWKTSEGATVLKENFSCPMWGTGFWREKYIKVYDYIFNEKKIGRNIDSIIKSGALDKMLDVSRNEFVTLCLSPDFEKTLAARMSDVSFRMYTVIQDKYIVVPTISKVRNWGFDGTGEYCQNTLKTNKKRITAGNYEYAFQSIDTSNVFTVKEDKLEDNEGNRKLMNKFDPLSLKAKLIMNGKLALFYIMGEKRFHKLTLFIRRNFK